MPIKILISLSLCALATHSQAQVYKCPDNGRFTYSDKPCRHGSNPSGAPIRADGYSVVPGLGSTEVRRTQSFGGYSAPEARTGQANTAPQRGIAFAQSASNPKPRQTISNLLPGGGSIAQREAYSRSQRSNSPSAPRPTIDAGPDIRYLKQKPNGKYVDNTGEAWRQKPGTNSLTSTSGQTCRGVNGKLHC